MQLVPKAPLPKPPLIVHIIYRLAIGGLENGLVNLINHMPPERYRHAIVCLTDHTDFRERIQRPEVPVFALHKRDGHDMGMHVRLWRVLRQLRPDIVQTRSLPALECVMTAALAGVPARIHGEQGRDVYDLDGRSFKYNLLRKIIRLVVHRYIAVSADLAGWLVRVVGASPERVIHIYNGVDTQRFYPRKGPRELLGPPGFAASNTFVVGTVGRVETVKDQLTLVRAFLHLIQAEPIARQRLRLVIIGDGPLREESLKLLRMAGADHLAWLPGERRDIPILMRNLDLFVLPSIAEGISNTILEAMASGLPVVATRVGGNAELVEDGRTGMLVPASNPEAMAKAIQIYLASPDLASLQGQAGRRRVEACFGMDAMVNGYLAVYDAVLNRHKRHTSANAPSLGHGVISN